MNQHDKLREAVRELLTARTTVWNLEKELRQAKTATAKETRNLIRTMRAAGKPSIALGDRQYKLEDNCGKDEDTLYEEPFETLVLDGEGK